MTGSDVCLFDSYSWNHKFLDYEIETQAKPLFAAISPLGWNHKFLDYEIETLGQVNCCGVLIAFLSWNHKFLDYEIETRIVLAGISVACGWNHKFLDYEIETWVAHDRFHIISLLES